MKKLEKKLVLPKREKIPEYKQGEDFAQIAALTRKIDIFTMRELKIAELMRNYNRNLLNQQTSSNLYKQTYTSILGRVKLTSTRTMIIDETALAINQKQKNLLKIYWKSKKLL